MNASRGVKRKRGPAKPHQSTQTKSQVHPIPEQILPGKLHHSLQEFKRLAKQAKVNETQIIVKKLKSLRSSDGKAKSDPARVVQDLEAQLVALKALNLTHFAAAALIQKLKHNRTLFADQTVSKFLSAELQPSLPLTYYAVEPNTAEGKIRNRLTSCKTFSGRASELVTDLQAILDPSVVKASNTAVLPTTAADDDEEDSEDQDGDEDGEDDFFDQMEPSDDQVDDDGWESGSIHSGDEALPNGPRLLSADSDSDSGPESGSGSDSRSNANSPRRSNPKSESKVKLRAESISGDDDDDSAPDSDSDGSLPPSRSQKKVPKPSGGAGASTFLPSLSIGYIPGDGDSDLEGELEVVEGKKDMKNRRGQRARRAIWEKKYGKGAKHVVKQREEEAEQKRIKEEKRRQREAAAKRPHWAAKNAFEPPKRTDSGYGGRIAVKSGGGGGGVDGQPPSKKPRRENKTLHPSWEAKKKMKEKESAAIIPPAGKKIVF